MRAVDEGGTREQQGSVRSARPAARARRGGAAIALAALVVTATACGAGRARVRSTPGGAGAWPITEPRAFEDARVPFAWQAAEDRLRSALRALDAAGTPIARHVADDSVAVGAFVDEIAAVPVPSLLRRADPASFERVDAARHALVDAGQRLVNAYAAVAERAVGSRAPTDLVQAANVATRSFEAAERSWRAAVDPIRLAIHGLAQAAVESRCDDVWFDDVDGLVVFRGEPDMRRPGVRPSGPPSDWEDELRETHCH